MAILRGGRRIGPFDIRLGLPRDKSLDNVQADERLGDRTNFTNKESVIGRFISNVAQGEGFARPTRYLVRIFLPNPPVISGAATGSFRAAQEQGIQQEHTINALNGQEMARNTAMMCSNIFMPSRDVNTKSHMVYGPQRQMPYAYSFSGNVQASFYGDKYLRQRAFFESWQKKIFNNVSHNMNYYNDYIGEMDILQLGSADGQADRDRITYGVRLYEVYPQTIGSIEYDYSFSEEIVRVPVTLNFRHWRNLTLDQLGNATIGDSIGKVPEIVPSKDYGAFGGILNNLPPELKRVGRDVVNQVRRSLPIGRVTGGRVFPPFL